MSSIFYALIIVTGHVGGDGGGYAGGLMWCPGLAALLACRLGGESIESLGWKWGAWRWQWLAYVVPLCYTAAAYAFVWYAAFGRFPDPQFVETARKSLNWSEAPDWVVVVGQFLLTGTTGMAWSAGHALGEEIGWRGFLSPRMTATFGLGKGAALTGLIWTAWHLPILLFADYNNGTPWSFGLPCFATMVISMSVMMAWLRWRSGRLCTRTIFHASHNLFVQGLFTPATGATGGATRYAIDEFGFALPSVALLFAIALLITDRLGRSPAE